MEQASREQSNRLDTSVPRRSLINSRSSRCSRISQSSHVHTHSESRDPHNVTVEGGGAGLEEDIQGLELGETDSVFDDDHLGNAAGDAAKLSGLWLWLSQYAVLMMKRFHYTQRNKLAFLVQTVLPLVLIVIGLIIARLLQTVPDLPKLELHPSLFFETTGYNYMFVGGYGTNQTSSYVDSLYRPCGVGAHTLGSSFDPESRCYADSTADYSCSHYPTDQYHCTCCPDRVPFPNPRCWNGTVTGSRLQNLMVPLDFSDPDFGHEFLTTHLLRSKRSFIEQRYGGLSFGHWRQEIDPTIDQIYTRDINSTLPFLATHSAAKVWYTLKGYHGMPAFLNTMNNAILRTHLSREKDPTKYGIRTYSHPFKMTDLQRIIYSVTEKGSFLINPLAAIFSLGFVAAGFVLILIEERSTKVKHLQLVFGLRRLIYWAASYTWDLSSYLIFIGAMLILYQCFQDLFFTSSEAFLPLVILLISYGLAVTPWMYLHSFLFSSAATAYVTLFCLNFFSGFCLLIVDIVLLYVGGFLDDENGNFMQYYLTAFPFPSYCLGRAMVYFSTDRPIQKFSTSLTFDTVPDPYSQIWPFIASLLCQSVLYTVIILMIELSSSYCDTKNCFSLPSRHHLPVSHEEEAVKREREKVEKLVRTSAVKDDNILLLDHVTRVYSSGAPWKRTHRTVVNQLCLAMQKSECFGLLGVNGAGKTTTFRMLTGDAALSHGNAYIASGGNKSPIHSARQSIGYCPQVDSMIHSLTGRQHLELFSRLRGLPPMEVKHVVDVTLRSLGLMEHADKPAGNYSGGNRRKLSTAIALLGRPPLILLDEPTSGVDPRARRFLWSIIRGVASSGQSVLLTTHSMAECEALCSRVGIMVNGTFRCLGTPQQLKSKYGEGYRLKLRVEGSIDPVKEFVRLNFVNSCLKEEHYNTLIYQLPTTSLSKIFELMEVARESLDSLEDYSVSQTTLDDVFIHFANQQREDAGVVVEEEEGSSIFVQPLSDTATTLVS